MVWVVGVSSRDIVDSGSPHFGDNDSQDFVYNYQGVLVAFVGDSSGGEDFRDRVSTLGELRPERSVLAGPLLGRVRRLRVLDRVGGHVAASHLQGDHWQREGEHDLTGVYVGQEELFVGDRAVELPSGEGRRQGDVVALIVDLPVRLGDLLDGLIRRGFHHLVGLVGQHSPGLGDRHRGAAQITVAQAPSLPALGGLGLQHRQGDRLGRGGVLEQLPRRGRGGLIQRLVRAAVVVVLAEPGDPVSQLLERGRPVRGQEPGQGLVGAFVLALGGRPARQPADRHRAAGGQEDLYRSDPARPQLVERQRVVREQLLGRAMGIDGPGQDFLGVSAVLAPGMGPGSHVVPGGIVQQLVDGHRLPAGELELEGVQPPQRHGRGAHERNVRGLRALARGGVDLADAGQQPGDRGHRRNTPARERLLQGGLVVDRARAVVPPVGLELLADPR